MKIKYVDGFAKVHLYNAPDLIFPDIYKRIKTLLCIGGRILTNAFKMS